MDQKHKLLLLAVMLQPVLALSQSNTVTTGGVATGTGGSSTYSIGQIDYISSTGTNGEINQGNQQPYEFYLLNELDESFNQISIIIGPNPTTDELNLIFKGEYQSGYCYDLIDEMGRLVAERKELLIDQKISMTQVASGKYFLNIYKNNDLLQSYQLIKTK